MIGLQKMVDALPETKHPKEMTVVKKYFQGRLRRCSDWMSLPARQPCEELEHLRETKREKGAMTAGTR
jgi:hypothetical protein